MIVGMSVARIDLAPAVLAAVVPTDAPVSTSVFLNLNSRRLSRLLLQLLAWTASGILSARSAPMLTWTIARTAMCSILSWIAARKPLALVFSASTQIFASMVLILPRQHQLCLARVEARPQFPRRLQDRLP